MISIEKKWLCFPVPLAKMRFVRQSSSYLQYGRTMYIIIDLNDYRFKCDS